MSEHKLRIEDNVFYKSLEAIHSQDFRDRFPLFNEECRALFDDYNRGTYDRVVTNAGNQSENLFRYVYDKTTGKEAYEGIDIYDILRDPDFYFVTEQTIVKECAKWLRVNRNKVHRKGQYAGYHFAKEEAVEAIDNLGLIINRCCPVINSASDRKESSDQSAGQIEIILTTSNRREAEFQGKPTLKARYTGPQHAMIENRAMKVCLFWFYIMGYNANRIKPGTALTLRNAAFNDDKTSLFLIGGRRSEENYECRAYWIGENEEASSIRAFDRYILIARKAYGPILRRKEPIEETGPLQNGILTVEKQAGVELSAHAEKIQAESSRLSLEQEQGHSRADADANMTAQDDETAETQSGEEYYVQSIATEAHPDSQQMERQGPEREDILAELSAEYPILFSTDELIHYFVRPEDLYALNSLELIDASELLDRILKSEGFVHVLFLAKNGDVFAYDQQSAEYYNNSQGKDAPGKWSARGKNVIGKIATAKDAFEKFRDCFLPMLQDRKSALIMPLSLQGNERFSSDVRDEISMLRVDPFRRGCIVFTLESVSELRHCLEPGRKDMHGDWTEDAAVQEWEQDDDWTAAVIRRLDRQLVQVGGEAPDEVVNLLSRQIKTDKKLSQIDRGKVYSITEAIIKQLRGDIQYSHFNALGKMGNKYRVISFIKRKLEDPAMHFDAEILKYAAGQAKDAGFKEDPKAPLMLDRIYHRGSFMSEEPAQPKKYRHMEEYLFTSLPYPYDLVKRDKMEIYIITKDAILLIECRTDDNRVERGTAFLIHPDGYALTCGHVVDRAQVIMTRYRKNDKDTWLVCDVVCRANADMALLKLETTQDRPEFPYLPLAEKDRKILAGEEYLMLGYPMADMTYRDVTMTEGSINSSSQQKDQALYEMRLLSGEGEKGASGSPIISLEDGLVVGIFRGEFQKNGRNMMRPIRYFWSDITKQGNGKVKTKTRLANGNIYYGFLKRGKPDESGEERRPDGTLLYEGKYKNGVREGEGKAYDESGALSFDGVFSNGSPVNGVLYYGDGSRYKGPICHDRVQAVRYYDNGWRCEGEFLDTEGEGFLRVYDADNILRFEGLYAQDRRNGHGTSYYPDGRIEYEGEYKAGKRSGTGTYHYTDGTYYTGKWKDDLREDTEGKKYRADGSLVCRGEYREDKFEGKGKEYYPDGTLQYDGEYKDNKRNGMGTYYYDNGNYYIGGWKDDYRDDRKGELRRADGSLIYKGGFKNDRREGKGKEYAPDGTLGYDGEYKDGKRNGTGTRLYTDGTYYIGEWKDGVFEGEGEHYRTDGSLIYKGEYKGNKRNGTGTYYYDDGSYYSGEWKDGLFEGEGEYYRADGSLMYKGEYKGDKRNGTGTYYFDDGTYYTGEWKDGVLEGEGEYYRADGSLKYKGEYKGDKRNGRGTLYNADGTYFVGEWKDGVAHGHGTKYRSDQSVIYEGEYANGSANGMGTCYYTDGTYYVGKWENGEREDGAGELYRKDGSLIHKGEYRNGKRAGKGREYYPDGRLKYDGEYKDGKRNGTGTYYFDDGSYYVGEWKDGDFEGEGEYYRVDGSLKYKGEYRSSKREGKGKNYYPDGTVKYDGEYKNDKWNGTGTYYFDDGSYYVGEWKDDARDGEGEYYRVDGSLIYKGEYRSSKREGKGKNYYPDGTIEYEGEFLADKRHGHGELHYDDGSVYRGDFVANNREGTGEMTISTGNRYNGSWKNDKLEGEGTYWFANGSSYSGEWKAGKYHGQGTFTWSDGRTYRGLFANGEMNGEGVMEYPKPEANIITTAKVILDDGSAITVNKCLSSPKKVVGTWLNDKIHGESITVEYYDGDRFHGEFRDGEAFFGILEFQGGGYYKGGFVNDLYSDDNAILDIPGVSVYEGGFRCGLKHGKGKERTYDGYVYQGTYVLGKRKGVFKVYQIGYDAGAYTRRYD